MLEDIGPWIDGTRPAQDRKSPARNQSRFRCQKCLIAGTGIAHFLTVVVKWTFNWDKVMSDRGNEPRRVLVVDDNQDAANSLAFLLTAAGYKVETAFNGYAALQAAERFDPDACVLDINMPGMNGYELGRRLRAMTADHPRVLATVTAYSDGDHLDRAAGAGFDLHFTKPADPGEVIVQLGECMAGAPLKN
jgi:two-component system OmpR family response regulator